MSYRLIEILIESLRMYYLGVLKSFTSGMCWIKTNLLEM